MVCARGEIDGETQEESHFLLHTHNSLDISEHEARSLRYETWKTQFSYLDGLHKKNPSARIISLRACSLDLVLFAIIWFYCIRAP